MRGIHRSPVNSPHKGQWRRALIFSLICAWLNGWVNNGETGDLRRHCFHYDITVMRPSSKQMRVKRTKCVKSFKFSIQPGNNFLSETISHHNRNICFRQLIWRNKAIINHTIAIINIRIMSTDQTLAEINSQRFGVLKCQCSVCCKICIMMSWHGNTFHITGSLCGESTGLC